MSLYMLLLVFLDICCICHAALRVAGATPHQRSLVHFTVAELQESTTRVKSSLRHALASQGAVVVTGVPGYERTAAEALDEFGKCLHLVKDRAEGGFGSEGPLRRTLASNVERTTLATSTKGISAQPLPAWAVEACPQLRAPAATLRAFVDWVATLFVQCVDAASEELLAKSAQAPARLSDALRLGTRIEHFHRYALPAPMGRNSSSLKEAASIGKTQPLQMHTDMGLLQALTIRWRAVDGLSLDVELPDGTTLSVEPWTVEGQPSTDATEGRGILFIVGQGLTDWMPHLGLRAAPHALVLSPGMAVERLVYGVMVLPPEDWPISMSSTRNTSFGEWWGRAQLALMGSDFKDERHGALVGSPLSSRVRVVDPVGLGCLSTGTLQRRLTDMSQSCGAGELSCWMQCIKIDDAPCGSESVCVSSTTNQACADDAMDPACALQCPVQNKSESNQTGNGFCSGVLTDMHMTGFVWSGVSNPCLVFLFVGVELTDSVRFWLAAAVTMVAGILAEYLVAVRRRQTAPAAVQAKSQGRCRAFANRAWRLMLYSSSRTLGYFVMLVTMTYSVELFIAVLLGLSLGHAFFNLNAPSGEDITACCQGGSEVVSRKLTKGQNAGLRSDDSSASRVRFIVTGMTCESCVNTVRSAVERLTEVRVVSELCLESGLLEVEFCGASNSGDSAACIQRVHEAVEGAGFSLEQVHVI